SDAIEAPQGKARPISRPWSRTGENPPYGILGGTMETSALFEARSAPSSYPTASQSVRTGSHGAQDADLARRFRWSIDLVLCKTFQYCSIVPQGKRPNTCFNDAPIPSSLSAAFWCT